MGSKWLTADDQERIENYLSKPAHERRIEDLVPDDDVPGGRRPPGSRTLL